MAEPERSSESKFGRRESSDILADDARAIMENVRNLMSNKPTDDDDQLTRTLKMSVGEEEFFRNARSGSEESFQGPVDRRVWACEWYVGIQEPDVALQMLNSKTEGDFVIRMHPESDSFFSLYYIGRGEKIYQATIRRDKNRFAIEGSDRSFASLSDLVFFYSGPASLAAGDLKTTLHVVGREELAPPSGSTPQAAVVATSSSQGSSDDEQKRAEAGEAWTPADVEDWLIQNGFAHAAPSFRAVGIDGSRLLRLHAHDLAALGIQSEEDQDRFFELARDLTIKVASRGPKRAKLRRKTLAVKEINGEVKIFDADTGKEMHKLSKAILSEIRETDPALAARLMNQQADADVQESFFWAGVQRGWVRRLDDGQTVDLAAWMPEDVLEWLQYVGLERCIPVVENEGLDGAALLSMTNRELEQLGPNKQVAGRLRKMWELLNCQVAEDEGTLNDTVAALGIDDDEFDDDGVDEANLADTEEEDDDYAMQPDAVFLSWVDDFARHTQWYRCGMDEHEALEDLDDAEAAVGAFVVRDDVTDPSQLVLTVLTKAPGADDALEAGEDIPLIKRHIRIQHEEGRGVHLAQSRIYGQDLSELVYIFAADNEEHPYMLDMETHERDHEMRDWYSDKGTVEDAVAKLKGAKHGEFMVHPTAVDDLGAFYLHFSNKGNVESVVIESDGERLHLQGSRQRFQTVSDLVDHYTFVRKNDLGIVLFQRTPHELMWEDLSDRIWFHPNASRDDAEDFLEDFADGAFIVREQNTAGAVLVISYKYKGKVRHALVDEDARGFFHLRRSDASFTAPCQLVEHYAAHQTEDLPCKLDVDAILKKAKAGKGHKTRPLPPIPSETLDNPYAVDSGEQQDVPFLGSRPRPWLVFDATREIVADLLADRPQGSFIIRDSTTNAGCLALSYVADGQIHHELIDIKTKRSGQKSLHLQRNPEMSFSNIEAFVSFYSKPSQPDLLHHLEPDDATTVTEAAVSESIRHQQRVHVSRRFLKESAPWLRLDLPRKDALSLLRGRPSGTFIIRQSETSPDCLVLSYVHENEIFQEYINMTDEGVCLEKAPHQTFGTFEELVEYYSMPRPELECALVQVEVASSAVSAINMRRGHFHMEAGRGRVRFGGEGDPRPRVIAEESGRQLTLTKQHDMSRRLRKYPKLIQATLRDFYLSEINDGVEELRAQPVHFDGRCAERLQKHKGQRHVHRRRRVHRNREDEENAHIRARRYAAGGGGVAYYRRGGPIREERIYRDGRGRRYIGFGGPIVVTEKKASRDRPLKHTGMVKSMKDQREHRAKVLHELGLDDTVPPDWLMLNTPRDVAIKMLEPKQGNFVVHAQRHAVAGLTMFHNGKHITVPIVRAGRTGLRLQGARASFPTIKSLVIFYTSPRQSDLPACLGPDSKATVTSE